MRKFVLYFMVFGIFFIAFDKVGGPTILEKNLGDQEEYVYDFDETTIEGEKIVLFDNTGLDHSRYYVINFTGEQYAYYTYYYMGDAEKYMNKYGEVSSRIVDYNYDEYMIKTLDEINYGTYEDIMEELIPSLEDDTLYIIY